MRYVILCYSQFVFFEDKMSARWPDPILLVETKNKEACLVNISPIHIAL